MNDWEVKSCRACLLQDTVSAMYDLAVPEVEKLFTECSNTNVLLTGEADSVPRFLCSMCYRICELWGGFRDRCQEAEKKFVRAKATKRKITAGPSREDFVEKVVEREVEPTSELELFLKIDKPEKPAKVIEPEVDEKLEYETTEVVMNGTAWSSTEDVDYEEEYMPGPPNVRMYVRTKKQPRQKHPRKVIIPEDLEFGPGPNSKGVWRYYLRGSDKGFSKCIVCDRIIKSPGGSTSNCWKHLERHNIFNPNHVDDNSMLTESMLIDKEEVVVLTKEDEEDDV